MDYLSTAQKIHYAHDWSLWVDTRKATSYFDHFCARMYSAAYANIPNDDFGLPTLDYLHMQASSLGHGCILPTYVDIPKMILAFQHWVICAYEQVPSDLDVFCVRTQIFLKCFWPSNPGLFAYMTVHRYSENVFGLPTLDYLRI